MLYDPLIVMQYQLHSYASSTSPKYCYCVFNNSDNIQGGQDLVSSMPTSNPPFAMMFCTMLFFVCSEVDSVRPVPGIQLPYVQYYLNKNSRKRHCRVVVIDVGVLIKECSHEHDGGENSGESVLELEPKCLSSESNLLALFRGVGDTSLRVSNE